MSTKKAAPYGSIKFKTIDEYHDSVSAPIRLKLDELRQVIRKAAPAARETISYNMPAFRGSTNLVYYMAHKNHIGFYPTSSPMKVFEKELVGFKTSKGAIQFPFDKPLPKLLIRKIVRFRLQEDETKPIPTKKSTPKEHIQYHKDGSIWAKGQMSGEHLHGYWEWYRKDGVIMRSGFFNKGKQTGKWTTYDKKGKVHKATIMK